MRTTAYASVALISLLEMVASVLQRFSNHSAIAVAFELLVVSIFALLLWRVGISMKFVVVTFAPMTLIDMSISVAVYVLDIGSHSRDMPLTWVIAFSPVKPAVIALIGVALAMLFGKLFNAERTMR